MKGSARDEERKKKKRVLLFFNHLQEGGVERDQLILRFQKKPGGDLEKRVPRKRERIPIYRERKRNHAGGT